jgi:hypothetical protein
MRFISESKRYKSKRVSSGVTKHSVPTLFNGLSVLNLVCFASLGESSFRDSVLRLDVTVLNIRRHSNG